MTTPSVTSTAGTPRRCEASSTSMRRASAAALRSGMPPFWIPVLPLAPPWFTVQAVSPITRGIAMANPDAAARYAEQVDDELREHRLLTSAMIVRAGEDSDVTGGIDADRGAF